MKGSWRAWKRAFMRELREPDYENKLLSSWLECKQYMEESVSKYMQRYETAVYRVKDSGAIQTDRFESQKVNRFVEGLRLRYRMQVSSSRPKTLEAAFSQARRLESWTEAEGAEGAYGGGRSRRKQVNAVETTPGEGSEMETMAEVAAVNATPNARQRGLPPKPCWGCGAWHWYDECTQKGMAKCDKCGRMGHITAFCLSETPGSGATPTPQQTPQQARPPLKCFSCQQFGHIAARCPRQGGGQQGGGGRGGGRGAAGMNGGGRGMGAGGRGAGIAGSGDARHQGAPRD